MIFDRNEVVAGNTLRIANPTFEGYARLISEDGEIFTEMESDYSRVIAARRWKIQFLPVDPELQLSPADRITQELQHERVTHRVIRFNAGCFTNAYREFGGDESGSLPEKDLLVDDFNGCF